MTDYENTITLFSMMPKLNKFAKKEYVKIHPVNSDIYNNETYIRYDCKTIMDQFILYHEGYLVVDVELTATANFAFKNCNHMIESVIVKINNYEIDNIQNHFLWVEILNHLEYSTDYSRMEYKYGYYSDTHMIEGANHHKTSVTYAKTDSEKNREKLFDSAIEADLKEFKGQVIIPLKYLSPFFRSLNFPLINNNIQIEIKFNLDRWIRAPHSGATSGVAGKDFKIKKTELIFPQIQLNTADAAAFYNPERNPEKQLIWYEIKYDKIDRLKSEVHQTHNITLNDVGVKKVFVVVQRYDAAWNLKQNYNQALTERSIRNTNIEIDSQLFYPRNIDYPIEFYNLTQECFNMQGTDVNTGALLNFSKWDTTHKYYCFDLSRQKVFLHDPRKAQTIRLMTTINKINSLEPNDTEFVMHIFYLKEKQTTINFMEPNKGRTI